MYVLLQPTDWLVSCWTKKRLTSVTVHPSYHSCIYGKLGWYIRHVVILLCVDNTDLHAGRSDGHVITWPLGYIKNNLQDPFSTTSSQSKMRCMGSVTHVNVKGEIGSSGDGPLSSIHSLSVWTQRGKLVLPQMNRFWRAASHLNSKNAKDVRQTFHSRTTGTQKGRSSSCGTSQSNLHVRDPDSWRPVTLGSLILIKYSLCTHIHPHVYCTRTCTCIIQYSCHSH